MIESLSWTGLFTALFLPWIVGSLLVNRLLLRSEFRNPFVVIGHGYLIGMIASSQALRLSDALLGGLYFWPVVGLVAFLGMGFAWSSRPVSAATALRHDKGTAVEPWQLALAVVFALLIANRLYAMAQELVLRPLYPWDAWMNWAPKSVVWFQRGELADFINPKDWLVAADRSAVYTLGNWRANGYPEGLPLIGLWTMLGAQTSAHPLLHLPWLLMAAALGMAFYGHLRLAAVPVGSATVGAYLLLSLPYLNVHTVLAGYADLWLTAAFSLAAFGLHASIYTGERIYLVLVVFFAVVCTLLKVPGIILAALLLVFCGFTALQLTVRKQLLLLALVVAGFLVALAVGIEGHFGVYGDLQLSLERVAIPFVGSTQLALHPVYGRLAEALFAMMNWNLLWYFYSAALFTLSVRVLRGRLPTRELGAIALLSTVATAMITVIFLFSDYYLRLLDMTTVNRAYLYVAPLGLFVVALYGGRVYRPAG